MPGAEEGKKLSARRATTYGAMDKEEEQMMANEGLSGTYDLQQLLTWRIVTVYQGTVFNSSTLWLQTGGLAVLFWALYLSLLYHRFEGFSEVVGSESSIRAFIAMFSMLIGLLLSFYTALNLNRWWSMRMGVENIMDGCKKLCMMVAQGVSSDPVLLGNIERYARASLYLIFAASQAEGPQDDKPIKKAYNKGLLRKEEMEKLEELNPHNVYVHAETLWVWLANAITKCHDQGLTKGPPHYCALLAAVEQARTGITDIQCYLETPIPFGYVHLLCVMVKLHNFLLTVLMALTCVMHSGGERGVRPIAVFRTAFRAFFMPFLYNSLLILNASMTDPFGNDASDFDWKNYDVNILMSTESFSKAATTLPDWITSGNFEAMAKV